MKKEDTNKFIGFPKIGEPGTFWMYPNVMDQYWYMLSKAEHKVIDYLLRRTFGFNKTKDRVGISQFVEGIKGHDRGIGLKDNAVRNALKTLEQKGFISIQRSVKETGENNANEYQLVMAKKPRGDAKKAPPPGARKTLPGGVGKAGTIDSYSINSSSIKRAIREIHACYKERIESGAKLTDGARDKIIERLSDENKFTPEELKQAILNFSQDEWWMDKNGKKGMWWFFRYPDRVEQFVNMKPQGYFED